MNKQYANILQIRKKTQKICIMHWIEKYRTVMWRDLVKKVFERELEIYPFTSILCSKTFKIIMIKLKSSLRKFYGRHHDLVSSYGVYVLQMTACGKHFPVLSSFMTPHRDYNLSNTTGAISGVGITCPSGAPEFTRILSVVRVTRSLLFCAIFCRWLFVFCPLLWPLCCMSFDLRFLITSLIS